MRGVERSWHRIGEARRPAYILIAVLGLAAVAATLGLSFINANSTVIPQAVNRYRGTRARYLAESGIAIARHYLVYPPATVAVGSFWTGAAGIAIDSTMDFTNVTIVQDAADSNQYIIAATGVAHDFDGVTVVGKHSITASVLLPAPPTWSIPYAYLATSTVAIPATAVIKGNIHSNASLFGQGTCQGNVSATGTATWFGGGPPASVTSKVSAFNAPAVDPSAYANYRLNGHRYTAYNYTKTDMGDLDAAALDTVDMSATNPGRIIRVPAGAFKLKKNVQLTGTLLVSGDLLVDNSNVQLAAVDGFPALVVSGSIRSLKKDASLTVTGSVLCGGAIDDGGTIVNLDVKGSLVCGMGFSTTGNNDVFVFQWSATRSQFLDVTNTVIPDPITLLSWKEN
ncbi:MAG: hypothetical protein ACE5F9_01790 [Phycisphaerae bacterium]